MKEVAKSVEFFFFFFLGGGGGWCDFGGDVDLSSRESECVLVRAGESLSSRGCVLEFARVWSWVAGNTSE